MFHVKHSLLLQKLAGGQVNIIDMQKLLITGFCDSQQIKNATDSAIARAVAVRDELVARGVVASNIRVTVNTRVRKKHAVEIKFD